MSSDRNASPAPPGRRVGLRTKLLGGFGIVLALTALIGVLGIRTAAGMSERATGMYDDALKPLVDLGVVRSALNQSRAFTDEHVMADDAATQKRMLDGIAVNAKDANVRLRRIQKSLNTPQEQATFAQLMTDVNSGRGVRAKVLQLSAANKKRDAIALSKSAGEPSAAKINTDLVKLFDLKTRSGETDERNIAHAEAA